MSQALHPIMRQEVLLAAAIVLLDVAVVQKCRDVGGSEAVDGSEVLHEVWDGGKALSATVTAVVWNGGVGGAVKFEQGNQAVGVAGDGDSVCVADVVDEVLV